MPIRVWHRVVLSIITLGAYGLWWAESLCRRAGGTAIVHIVIVLLVDVAGFILEYRTPESGSVAFASAAAFAVANGLLAFRISNVTGRRSLRGHALLTLLMPIWILFVMSLAELRHAEESQSAADGAIPNA